MVHPKILDLVQYVESCAKKGLSIEDILHTLAQEGIIPPLIKRGMVSNDRYTFAENGQMTELECSNVQCFRMYWDTWNLGEKGHSICKQFVRLLPGQKCHCKTCGWHMPQYEMQNQQTCCYCHDKEEVRLNMHNNTSYITLTDIGRMNHCLSKIKITI